MYIADLHIHSRYSRATSKDCTPEHLDLGARRKGIHLVGTGDFTHPAWREELREKLVPAEDGLYVLKEEYQIQDETCTDRIIPRFVITGEISSIYKKNGRVRKVHSLILLPGLEEAEVISRKLEAIGNIHSDGRPILGLDCRDLLEIVLELCPEAIFVPAHIWTPHFSLFGAFSGFDTVEECFEDLSPYIHAMETGLSSDPPMNWRVSALDSYHLISNSDAHSPAKLGREANLLDIELSYQGLYDAIQKGQGLSGTIEFFPEEGKYHFDGHRKCNLCLSPLDTEKYQGICPVCKRKITIGVSHRVEQLADRAEGYVRADARPFESLVPLPEVIGASVGHSAASARVQKEYQNMLRRLGPEFDILRTMPLEEIRSVSGYLISEGIGRLREGKVERIPGFDGEYGTIKLFAPSEIENTSGQMDFFDLLGGKGEGDGKGAKAKDGAKAATEEGRTPVKVKQPVEDCTQQGSGSPLPLPDKLNREQEQAVRSTARTVAVIAGPGTGKTKTLISHILYLIENRKVKPGEITAVTFTNQAASQMRERLRNALGKKKQIHTMQIGTFHAICLAFLKDQGREFSILDEEGAQEIARGIIEEYQLKDTVKKFLYRVSGWKAEGEVPQEDTDAFLAYQKYLEERRLLDFDDLLLETLKLIEEPQASAGWEKHFSYLLVDEFQDINPLQYRLLKAWNKKGRELFVIGDPDQSIYGFRGADASCFDRLVQEHAGTDVIRLAENYRSTPQILNAALAVISHNPGEDRRLAANREDGDRARLVTAESGMGEAIFIAKEINRLAGGIGMLEAHELSGAVRTEGRVRGFDEIAILYRTNHQGDLLEKCLKKEGIPYIVAGRGSFLQEEKVRGSICFFRYLDNPMDILAKEQCLRLLWNMDGNLAAEEVLERMAGKYRPLYQKKKPQKFLELWMEELQLEDNEAVKKLAGMGVFYKTMAEFMSAIQLGIESDIKRCGNRDYASGAVTLMTLHGAKGLEFPVTFIYGVRKGLIPLESEKGKTDLEEERRLLYVGMTRAMEELILTTSKEASGFLEGVPSELLERETAHKRRVEQCHQMSLFEL